MRNHWKLENTELSPKMPVPLWNYEHEGNNQINTDLESEPSEPYLEKQTVSDGGEMTLVYEQQ